MSSIKNWLVLQMLNRFKIPRDIIRFAFKHHKKNKLIISNDKTVTFQELENRILSLATGIYDLGLQKGDAMFVMVTNGIHQIEVALTSYETGIVLSSFHVHYSKENILKAAKLIRPKLFIYNPSIAKDVAVLLKKEFKNIQLLEIGSEYENLISKHQAKKSKNKISPTNIAAIGFTSGTTGNPKALPATHGVFVKSLQLVVKNVGIGQKKKNPDKFLVGIPLVGAGSGVVLPSLLSGSAIVIPQSYDAREFLELIDKHKITRMFITPSLLIDILDYQKLDNYDFSSLENIIYGTETLAAAKLEEAIKKFGPILQQGYGSAEVLPPVSMLQPKDHMENGKIADRNILTSVGIVVPQVKVKIVDDANYELRPLHIGHVLIKSPTLFTGYWKQPELNAKTFIDGWLKIGDVGYLEPNKRLHILGREADVIKKGNQIIYPRIVEEQVHNHPAVKECVLVQVNDNAVLAISLRNKFRKNTSHNNITSEILDILKDSVERYQYPDTIEFFEELPRSFLAKVLRREVRDILKNKTKIAI